jgi:hypothetical protein
MKLQLSLILCLLLSTGAFAQKKQTNSAKDKAIAEHFKTDYKKKNYKKFDGKITLKENQVLFDDKTINYDKSDKIMALMLQQGLIYPQLLTEYQINKFNEDDDKTQKRFVKLQKNWQNAFEVNNVKLSETSELNFPNNDPKIKRFKTTYKDAKIDGTSTYLIELTNKNAVKDTPIDEFIKNSKLTYLQQL